MNYLLINHDGLSLQIISGLYILLLDITHSRTSNTSPVPISPTSPRSTEDYQRFYSGSNEFLHRIEDDSEYIHRTSAIRLSFSINALTSPRRSPAGVKAGKASFKMGWPATNILGQTSVNSLICFDCNIPQLAPYCGRRQSKGSVTSWLRAATQTTT